MNPSAVLKKRTKKLIKKNYQPSDNTNTKPRKKKLNAYIDYCVSGTMLFKKVMEKLCDGKIESILYVMTG